MLKPDIFSNLPTLLTVVIIICLLVLVAIGIDFASCIYKSTQILHQPLQSTRLRSTISKILSYLGCILIGSMLDILILFTCAMFSKDYYIPIVTCLFGAIAFLVEAKSVKEKASDKQQRDIEKMAKTVTKLAGAAVDRKLIEELVYEIIKKKGENTNEIT